MEELPDHILSCVALDAVPVLSRWWRSLNESDRYAALIAWDEERQNQFFAAETDDPEPVPLVIGGRFVPVERTELVGPEWRIDYYEYLLNNPEFLLPPPAVHHFGAVCTAHADARSALAAGCIPAGFVCPLGSSTCPMRQLLDSKPNHSLQLLAMNVRRNLGCDLG